MKIIVAGTGKVGNLLADQLTRDGHDLVVIDKNSAAWKRLWSSMM